MIKHDQQNPTNTPTPSLIPKINSAEFNLAFSTNQNNPSLDLDLSRMVSLLGCSVFDESAIVLEAIIFNSA
jgi:hypothetical protein